METINYHDNPHSFIAVALLHLMGDEYKEIMPEGNKGTFEIEVKLNGVEVSFSTLLNLIEEGYDKAVAIAAYKLIEEKFGKVENAASRIVEHMKQVARTELGIEEYDVERFGR